MYFYVFSIWKTSYQIEDFFFVQMMNLFHYSWLYFLYWKLLHIYPLRFLGVYIYGNDEDENTGISLHFL